MIAIIAQLTKAWFAEAELWQHGSEGPSILAPGQDPLGYHEGLNPNALAKLKATYEQLASYVAFEDSVKCVNSNAAVGYAAAAADNAAHNMNYGNAAPKPNPPGIPRRPNKRLASESPGLANSSGRSPKVAKLPPTPPQAVKRSTPTSTPSQTPYNLGISGIDTNARQALCLLRSHSKQGAAMADDTVVVSSTQAHSF